MLVPDSKHQDRAMYVLHDICGPPTRVCCSRDGCSATWPLQALHMQAGISGDTVHIIARPMQPHELPSYRQPDNLAARRDLASADIRSGAVPPGFSAPQSRLSRTWTGGHFPSRVETPSTSYRKPPCVSVVVSKCTPVQRPASDIACKVLIRSKHLYSSLQCTCIEMLDSASSFVDSIVVVSGACAVYNVLMRL